MGLEIEPFMDWGAFFVLTAVLGGMVLIVQRAERKRRRVAFVVMLVGAELVRRYVVYRGWDTEGLVALVTALLLNGLFWLFIGRSNPPGSSDDIQVLGNE